MKTSTNEGLTYSPLGTPQADHKVISSRTGQRLLTPAYSRIRDRSIYNNHQIVQADFKIHKTCRTKDLKTTESVLIPKHRPYLNNHDSSVLLNILG